ncbi:hypothetical protein LUZ60_017322 [Juncus effusus]|nr:hypothetical protein LUZ60_017322 [Juncus effusus]
MASGVQGQLLHVTVLACSNLKYPRWLKSEPSPFVWLKHPSSEETRTIAWTGVRNPVFVEKFEIPLIEGLSTITVDVWNSSSTPDYKEFIARGWVTLDKVLT